MQQRCTLLFLQAYPTLQAARSAEVSQVETLLKQCRYPGPKKAAAKIVEQVAQPSLAADAVTTRTKSRLMLALVRQLLPVIEEIAAYDAPFPDETYKAGARRFPALVPITPEHPSVAENKAAWDILKTFEKPFLTTFSDKDPIMEGGERIFHKLIPGAADRPHVTIREAGHFLQEDKPHQLVEVIDSFIEKTR